MTHTEIPYVNESIRTVLYESIMYMDIMLCVSVLSGSHADRAMVRVNVSVIQCECMEVHVQ